MSMDEMTVGEIGRSLTRLEKSQERQTATLEDIKKQTTITNGRVTAIEGELRQHAFELRELKKPRRIERHESERTTDRPDVITINIPASAISPKAIATIVAAVIAGLIAAWRAGFF